MRALSKVLIFVLLLTQLTPVSSLAEANMPGSLSNIDISVEEDASFDHSIVHIRLSEEFNELHISLPEESSLNLTETIDLSEKPVWRLPAIHNDVYN